MTPGPDTLQKPLTSPHVLDGRHVREVIFGDLDIPVGCMKVSVTYRTECGCKFRVEDAESILSSRFMGIDENFFLPSALPLPEFNAGGLSTSNCDSRMGTSTGSACVLKPPDTHTDGKAASILLNQIQPHSLPSAFQGRMPFHGRGQRASLSLCSSNSVSISSPSIPQRPDVVASSLPQSINQPSTPSHRTPRTHHQMQDINPGVAQARATSPSTYGNRYHSSFHGRDQFSVGHPVHGGDKNEFVSKNHPPVTTMEPSTLFRVEPRVGTEASSIADDNIEEFLKTLDDNRTLKSFEPISSQKVTARSPFVQLDRFYIMKESNAALEDSLASSIRVLTPTEYQRLQTLSTIDRTSVADDHSPSTIKPHAPHISHTPTIPSRLSEHISITSPLLVQDGRRSHGLIGENALSMPDPGNNDNRSYLPSPSSQPIIDQHTGIPEGSAVALAFGHMSEADDPLSSSAQSDRIEALAGPPESAQISRHNSNSSNIRHQLYSAREQAIAIASPALDTSPLGRRRYIGIRLGARTNDGPGEVILPTPVMNTIQSDGLGQSVHHQRSSDMINSDQVGCPSRADDEPLVFHLSDMDANIYLPSGDTL
jgi:autophagy-related protein 13